MAKTRDDSESGSGKSVPEDVNRSGVRDKTMNLCAGRRYRSKKKVAGAALLITVFPDFFIALEMTFEKFCNSNYSIRSAGAVVASMRHSDRHPLMSRTRS
jgi:hypothetical protein